MSSINSSRWYR